MGEPNSFINIVSHCHTNMHQVLTNILITIRKNLYVSWIRDQRTKKAREQLKSCKTREIARYVTNPYSLICMTKLGIKRPLDKVDLLCEAQPACEACSSYN